MKSAKSDRVCFLLDVLGYVQQIVKVIGANQV